MQNKLLQFICIKKLYKQKQSYKSIIKFASLPLAKKQIMCSIALLFVIKLSWATHHYDTIIIGAGVSGLTAAHHLHKAQQKVLIIEQKTALEAGYIPAMIGVSPLIWGHPGFMPLKTTH